MLSSIASAEHSAGAVDTAGRRRGDIPSAPVAAVAADGADPHSRVSVVPWDRDRLSLEEWDFTESVSWVLLAAIAGATGSVFGAGRNLGWIRASAAGLEFAATRRRPVFLPWSAVRSVGLRFAGPWTELPVTPTSLNAAIVVAVPAWVPWVRRRSGAAAFIVDVGLMTPGPSALLAELNRRLVAHR
ncbi:hypothetical protein Q0Z83_035990 [Actinoplanes sichuanensis]|uniref:Uncharacterized protein n=1 Tax=Actinoplanes sichuanensis TaxID=512349 RepID=A0ABW4ABE5_9ACTN|nr:hypothetical protein [Actinoplanes sichuanensis]BEL05408.1 hypothetical protein Q0Z83_035990 [Actinoplanes sichuanensis]